MRLGSLDKLRPIDSQLLDELVHDGILSLGVQNTHSCYFFNFSAQTWPVVLEPWFKLHDGAFGTSWNLNMSEAFIQQRSLCPGCELNIPCCMKHQSWVNFCKNFCPFFDFPPHNSSISQLQDTLLCSRGCLPLQEPRGSVTPLTEC